MLKYFKKKHFFVVFFSFFLAQMVEASEKSTDPKPAVVDIPTEAPQAQNQAQVQAPNPSQRPSRCGRLKHFIIPVSMAAVTVASLGMMVYSSIQQIENIHSEMGPNPHLNKWWPMDCYIMRPTDWNWDVMKEAFTGLFAGASISTMATLSDACDACSKED